MSRREPQGPLHAHIEPTTFCNLRCPSCYNPALPASKKGSMSLATFREVLDRLPTVKDVSLLGLGEPFMNRELLGMAEEAHARGITVRTVTNGTLLHREDPLRVLKAFDELVLSLDAATPALFEQLRLGAEFAAVWRSMLELAALRSRHSLPIQLTTNTVLTRSNEGDLAAVFEAGKGMGAAKMRFVMAADVTSNTEALRDRREAILAMRLQESGRESRLGEQVVALSRSTGIPASFAGSTPLAPSCWWPLRGTYICFDGKVTPCCMRMDSARVCYGNVLENPMEEIWNRPAYRDLWQQMHDGRVPEICQGCP